jgi:hypothetical protein
MGMGEIEILIRGLEDEVESVRNSWDSIDLMKTVQERARIKKHIYGRLDEMRTKIEGLQQQLRDQG